MYLWKELQLYKHTSSITCHNFSEFRPSNCHPNVNTSSNLWTRTLYTPKDLIIFLFPYLMHSFWVNRYFYIGFVNFFAQLSFIVYFVLMVYIVLQFLFKKILTSHQLITRKTINILANLELTELQYPIALHAF